MKNLVNNKFFILFFCPFLLGSITILSFPPFNFTFINFISFSVLLFLIQIVKKKTKTKYRKKKSNRYFFYLGATFGFSFFLFGNYWISISLTHDDIFKDFIILSLILIPLFLSLFFGLAILIVGPFVKENISFVLFFSLVFTLFEFIRGNILTGFPWNLMAYTWSWSLETMQILSLIGTYALSLISITLFCIPFLFFKNIIIKKNVIFFLTFLTIFAINYLYGSYKIKNTKYNFDKNINVKIVSPNFSLKNYKTEPEIEQLKRLIKISSPNKNKKTLFVWPEGIFYESNLQNISLYKELFMNKFSENHLIAFGINNFEENKDLKNTKYFNSLVIVNNKLEVMSVYNKVNLVPFGEFLPFEKFLSTLGLKKVTRGYNSFSSGNGRSLINLGDNFSEKLILPIICYEIIYSNKIKLSYQEPDILINISEDAWFGNSIGPHQHFSKVIYRAVEEGIFVARSANRGISAFVDPNGRLLKSLNSREAGNIELNFPYFNGSTLFSEYGNKIFFLIIFLYIFLFLIFRKFKI